MSLLGLLRHMTFVEQVWFDARFAGNDVIEYYRRPDDREVEWTELESATLDVVVTNFQRACETSDELARAHDLDEMVKNPGVGREPQSPSVALPSCPATTAGWFSSTAE